MSRFNRSDLNDMFQKKGTKYFQGDGRMPTSAINYRDIITEQVRMTSYFLSTLSNEESVLLAENSVNVLESLLIRQVLSRSYQKSLNNVNDRHKKELKKMSNKQKGKTWVKMKKNYIFSKFRLLMLLLSRTGISYVPEVDIEVGGSNSIKLRGKKEKKQ